MPQWWSEMNLGMKLAAVASLLTIVIGIPSAWAVLGFPVPASREWVDAQYGERLRGQSETLYEIRRSQIDREIFDLERRDKRSQSDEWRLHQLRDQLKRLDSRGVK